MAPGPTGRPATIYDVAARAKLSIATVSRVLQGTGPVSAKARARVDQAAQELNYVPLRAARSLAVQRHEAHGLVLPDLAGPFYGDLLMGYERWAGEHGQSVIITVGQGNPRSIRDLAGRVDGMVVHADAVADPTIQDLRKAGVPIVLIAHPPIPGCDSVRSENLLSAEQLTGRLLDSGRKHLLFVGDPATPYDAPARYAGFCNAHTNRGLGAPEPARVELNEDSGAQFAEQLLQAKKLPDGLVCGNDETAVAAMKVLQKAGVSIPGDIAVTGWDDVMAARYVTPGLTTVRQPIAELGRLAAQRLHERVTGERSRARNDVLATEVVLRDSCGTNRGMHAVSE
ncbi:LacI family transcriptional regulator [Kribbella sp. NBC_00709]|uniref:LacI family DNA-binding transcriptional regulator n=1 Tax=Kribbella sp. NBC_00709 TaxID=2975972 RepID=UPI002E2E73BA|nr:LacI family DNA-binding transcriptional regulator [Kribbella sp. NBC_00709]